MKRCYNDLMEFKQDGIINVCKPMGVSSFKFLKQVQHKLGINKVGHLGTLDPAACGVLVLLCGRATKLMNQLSGGTKVYRSVFTFGVETDTLDAEGEVVATSAVIPTADAIRDALDGLVGEVEIEVPKYSAVHIGGQRAYDLARRGIDFTVPKKTVRISRFQLLHQLSENKFFFEIECETGTYVRSLAKVLANRLGSVAIASTIIRTKVGEYEIHSSKCLHNIQLSDISFALNSK